MRPAAHTLAKSGPDLLVSKVSAGWWQCVQLSRFRKRSEVGPVGPLCLAVVAGAAAVLMEETGNSSSQSVTPALNFVLLF